MFRKFFYFLFLFIFSYSKVFSIPKNITISAYVLYPTIFIYSIKFIILTVITGKHNKALNVIKIFCCCS